MIGMLVMHPAQQQIDRKLAVPLRPWESPPPAHEGTSVVKPPLPLGGGKG